MWVMDGGESRDEAVRVERSNVQRKSIVKRWRDGELRMGRVDDAET